MAAKSDFLGTWLQGFCPQESRRDRLILPQQHVFLLFSLQLPSSPSLVFIYPFPPRFSINSFCVTFIFPSQLLLQLYRPYTPYRTPLVCHLSIFALSFSTHRLKIALLHPDVCQMLTPYQAFIFFIRFSIYILRCFFNFLKAFVFLIAPARHIPVGINTSTTNPSSLCSPRGPCAPHLLQS